MKNLIKRYIMNKSRDKIDEGVTEDDINEIKQDISSFRYELLEILRNNSMEIPDYSRKNNKLGSKRLKKRDVGRRMSYGYCVGSRLNSPSNARVNLGATHDASFSSSMDDMFENIESKRTSDESHLSHQPGRIARSKLGQIVMKTFHKHRSMSREVPDGQLDTELGTEATVIKQTSACSTNSGETRHRSTVPQCASEDPLLPSCSNELSNNKNHTSQNSTPKRSKLFAMGKSHATH